MTEDEFEAIAKQCRMQMAIADGYTERFQVIGADATWRNLFDIARKMGLRDDETASLTHLQALSMLDEHIHHLAELERSRERVEGAVMATPSPAAGSPSKTSRPTSCFAPLDDEYRTIRYRGETHVLTKNQAACVKKMDLGRRQGIPEMSEGAILRGSGISTRRLQQIFRLRRGGSTEPSPLWGTLIVKGSGKDMFRLNVE